MVFDELLPELVPVEGSLQMRLREAGEPAEAAACCPSVAAQPRAPMLGPGCTRMASPHGTTLSRARPGGAQPGSWVHRVPEFGVKGGLGALVTAAVDTDIEV